MNTYLPSLGYETTDLPISNTDVVINWPEVSNRHFLIFSTTRQGRLVAILTDLSTNGTFVNDAILGRNNNRFLEEGDKISLLGNSFVFRYHVKKASDFQATYRIIQQFGQSRTSTVYLCTDRSTGKDYAAKFLVTSPGNTEEFLRQARGASIIASVCHRNIVSLKQIFNESDCCYQVWELVRGGDLFNLIVSKQKLSEAETRHIFNQLFEAVKYLVNTTSRFPLQKTHRQHILLTSG